MVPSQIVVLEDLPVLANGKVNRNALLAPDTASHTRSKPYVAPRTMVEEVIAGIWASLLATEQVGRDDDFFELGGHSLRATQLVVAPAQVFRCRSAATCDLRGAEIE
jgi:hypothetical protein